MKVWFQAFALFAAVLAVGIAIDMLNIFVLHSDKFENGGPTYAALSAGIVVAWMYVTWYGD
jgi:hypothetical protein